MITLWVGSFAGALVIMGLAAALGALLDRGTRRQRWLRAHHERDRELAAWNGRAYDGRVLDPRSLPPPRGGWALPAGRVL